MGNKSNISVMIDGTINSSNIYDAHRKIKEIVEAYKDINLRVNSITTKVNENWVGKGQNEFESQYKLLINKIEDFGDTLQDIYDALVEAEATYEEQDDNIRKDFVKATTKGGQ